MLLSGKLSIQGVIVIAAFCMFSILLSASAPRGWMLAGSKPADYDTGVDPSVRYNQTQSAYLKSKFFPIKEDRAFGTLMQSFRADQYLGKRVRFRGFVKTDDVQDWAGLWMRIDKGSAAVAFDNMQDRPIQGTGDWREYSVVLDVPADATGIAFGILLSKTGEVWLNSANFEVVTSEVPVTGKSSGEPQPTAPVNLNFEK